MRIAVCSGSFDPITLGHVDVIRRAAQCFDQVLVCVSPNAEKRNQMFTPEQKLLLVQKAVEDIPNVEAELWSGLLADYAVERQSRILVKGLRHATDFDQEYQMAAINKGLCHDLETVFLPASAAYQHFSSTMVREMIRYGQPMEKYVPAAVVDELKKRQ